MEKKSNFIQRYLLCKPIGNVHVMLLYRITLVMLLSTICRILFYAFNTGFYPNMTFGHFCNLLLGGMRFDILGLVYVNSLYIFFMLIPFKFRYNKTYQSVFKYLFFATNGIALMANCADIIYFRFTMRRTTFAVFREFENESNMTKLFGDFLIQYWYILLIFIALVTIMVLFYGKMHKPKFKKPLVYYPLNTVFMLIGIALVVIAARGDFSPFNRPITLSNAAEYTKEPIEMPLVQSTPTAIIKTLFNSDLVEYRFFDNETDLDKIYAPVKNYNPQGDFTPKNVVILILESFSTEYMKAYNEHMPDYKSLYTPFLDSLMQHSYYFSYSFANGRKSIDAMPSVLASIPSIEGPYVLSPYSSNQINGIASILRKKDYYTAFFHGAPNGSMGFSAVANLTGFEHYFGMTEFNNLDYFDKTNGIFDEEFFQYYADEMNKMAEPFCTALFSLSSHTPFTLPSRYKDVFTGAPTPFLNSLRYSDYSLKRFFETASKMPWFKNTLFILSADHGGTYSILDEYKTSVGVFAAPIIFYAPGDSTLIGRQDRLAQQIDILPSILSYLNYKGDFVAFGNNLFENTTEKDFVVNFPNMLQLFWEDYVIHFDGEKITALYKFKEDLFLRNNLVGTMPLVEKEMNDKAKAFLQQYSTRLIENRLTVREK